MFLHPVSPVDFLREFYTNKDIFKDLPPPCHGGIYFSAQCFYKESKLIISRLPAKMGLLSGLVKRLIKFSLYSTVLAAIIVFIPNLPPYTKFTSISLDPALPRVGPLAPNEALNNPEKVLVDKLLGPESFYLYRGELYTSLATGEIVKISPGGHITFVTKLGQPCKGITQEHICGRPLGFQIDEKNNVMYIADAYHGIWRVDLKTDKKQLLVSPRVAIEGRQPKLMNALALSKNGDFYWTDSSSDFQFKDGTYTSLCDPSGRLLYYNAAKNQSKVLLDNLWFPNGIVLSPDNQYVVFAETMRFSLAKYYIDGPKKGKSEVLVTGLPGIPDNVRVLPDGSGILVGLYITYDEENPLLARSLAAAPLARKLVARIQRLIEIPFEYLQSVYPHVIFEDIVYFIGHFKSLSSTMPKQSGLVVVDWNGNIVESYYNTDGSLGHISDAIVYNNRLYTGNPHLQNFIGSVPVPPLLKKAFGSKPEAPTKTVETPKPRVEEKPKVLTKEAPKPAEIPKPKVEEKPKVVKREAPKPVEPPKPKVEEKPKVVKKEAPKPAEAPKPKVEEKPKEVKREAPKPVQEKPAPPKAKPVEAKPTLKTAPAKSAEPSAQPKPTPKPEAVKAAEPKPTPKPEPVKPAQSKQEKPTPKPEPKPTPKVNTKPPSQTPQPEKKSTQEKKQSKAAPKPEPEEPIIITYPRKEARKDEPTPVVKNKLAPENIPIKEEIRSDTTKPSKEKLKVIKRDGPGEIRNPHL